MKIDLILGFFLLNNTGIILWAGNQQVVENPDELVNREIEERQFIRFERSRIKARAQALLASQVPVGQTGLPVLVLPKLK